MAQVLAFSGSDGRKAVRRNPYEPLAALGPRPSPYDKRNIDLYARLLDEEASGSSPDAMVREVLHLDPRDGKARAILSWHLDRAHWIAELLSPIMGW